MSPLVVSVSDAKKTFGDVKALNGIDLTIAPGIFGLIGPNGAGKTTLLRILLGLVPFDAGSAEVLGMDVRTESLKIRQKIGVLHERTVVPAHMLPIDYLYQVKRFYRSEVNPKQLLEMIGLVDIGGRRIRDLSAGMRQRLGIALAFAGDPELVFLDEPTSNLDVLGREKVLDLIYDLHNETGVSFVITSHILSEVQRVCNRIAFIKEGLIVEHGDTYDLIQKYTKDRYIIRCSEAHTLAEELTGAEGLLDVRTMGPNTVSIKIEGDIRDVLGTIEQEAARTGVKVFSIEESSALEDAFKEVIYEGMD